MRPLRAFEKPLQVFLWLQRVFQSSLRVCRRPLSACLRPLKTCLKGWRYGIWDNRYRKFVLYGSIGHPPLRGRCSKEILSGPRFLLLIYFFLRFCSCLNRTSHAKFPLIKFSMLKSNPQKWSHMFVTKLLASPHRWCGRCWSGKNWVSYTMSIRLFAKTGKW